MPIPSPMNSGNSGFLSSNTTPLTNTSQGLGNYFNQPQQNTTNTFGMKNSLFGGSITTNNTNPFSSINQTGFLSNNNNNTQTNTPTLFGQTSNNIFNQPQQQQQSLFAQPLFPQQNQQQNTLFQQNNPFTTNTSNNQNTLFQNYGANNQSYPNQNFDELAYHQYINDLYQRTVK